MPASKQVLGFEFIDRQVLIFRVVELVGPDGFIGANHERYALTSDSFQALIRTFHGAKDVRGDTRISWRNVEIVRGPFLRPQSDAFEILIQRQARGDAKYFRVDAQPPRKFRL